MRKILLPVAGLALMVAANGALAASNTSNFNVKVQVNAACTVTATDMNFGTFAGSIPASTATSTATVICNKGVPYALSLAAGTGVGGLTPTATATASMANGAATPIPASLTVATASQTATGGSDATVINGSIAAVTTPATGTYTVAQAIYVLY